MRFFYLLPCLAIGALGVAACSGDDDDDNGGNTGGRAGSSNNAGSNSGGSNSGGSNSGGSGGGGSADLTFFVTSQTGSGDLGGLAGADQRCQTLAAAVGAGGKTWRAYLSVEDDGSGQAVDARDRIGGGPWVNAAGDEVAADLDGLHARSGDVDVFLDEKGQKINGQWVGSPKPNEHDILTGSTPEGRVQAGKHCNNWTSDGDDFTAQLGHSDGLGPQQDDAPPRNSWQSAHGSQGCSASALGMTGGAGRFYCFATN